MQELIPYLPHVNASLNLLCTILLMVGFVLIKRGRIIAHRNTMVAAFATSVVFLVCYLFYHSLLYVYLGGHGKPFPKGYSDTIRYTYFGILISHVVLAMTVPVLAIVTLVSGYRDDRPRHRWWAKRTFPIWLYVSVTGVIVYLMLYILFPETGGPNTIE